MNGLITNSKKSKKKKRPITKAEKKLLAYSSICCNLYLSTLAWNSMADVMNLRI